MQLGMTTLLAYSDGQNRDQYYAKVFTLTTSMHSSRMRTARCNGRFSCHTLPATDAPCHAHPLSTHTPCHACPPPPHMPPTMHTPATHAPMPHIYTLPCTPPAMHAPLWIEFLTHACENITLPQLRCGQ